MNKIILTICYVIFLAWLSGCETQTSSPNPADEDSWERASQAAGQVELTINTYPLDAMASDTCAGETFEGRCAGNTLIWCEDCQTRTAHCKRACGWDRSNSFYNCL